MTNKDQLRALPGVDTLLERPDVTELVERHGRDIVTFSLRKALEAARDSAKSGEVAPDAEAIAGKAGDLVEHIRGNTLKPVINATGIILHTNLGRAPLGKAVIGEIAAVAGGYSSLEFDLEEAHRGNRGVHVRELLKFLTGAEDALVVNNNAGGIVLALNTLAKGGEVIVSRGELIEIGGSFRIPEIMAASGAKMVEVGSTNRTRAKDYRKAIGRETAAIFKAHKSNYSVHGFTEEVPVGELAELAHRHDLPLIYDIGSGLLRRPQSVPIDEPDVQGAVRAGADIVAFSCDKLLGGPQAGVLAGRAELIARFAEAPLMRALRVGKLTYAALIAACRAYLRDEDLVASNPTFAMLSRTPEELDRLAGLLLKALKKVGIQARKAESKGQCGGGTLPDLELKSVAVEIIPPDGAKKDHAQRLHRQLLQGDRPVLGALREGKLVLDALALSEENIPCIGKAFENIA